MTDSPSTTQRPPDTNARVYGSAFDMDRRQFGRLALTGAAAGTTCFRRTAGAGTHADAGGARIKLSVQVPADPSDDDLRFVAQLGVGYVNIPSGGNSATLENYLRLRRKVETTGLKIWNIGNSNVHNMEEVTLNLPGRDQKIEEYKTYLRNLGKVGIHYTTYAHMGNGIWSTAREPARGGASSRAFDLSKADKGVWAGKTYKGPLTHGRVYSSKEIWDNYSYFIKAVIPVAVQEGIRIGIHPDDPPVPELGGVPRCIFGSFDGYRRALEIADSPNVGICLCVGCWLEGGNLMGKGVLETIRYFGTEGKIFKVHFRNVNAPLPHFAETFLDDGYMDMYKVMKALREVNFDGVVIADHVPDMVGGPRTATAYSIGYMKALIDRANAEARG
jgi:mannonate dehydratase